MVEHIEDCDECGNAGWMWDDLSSAMGGTPFRFCDCKHGDRAAKQHYGEMKKREGQSPFKTCPTCKGEGQVRRYPKVKFRGRLDYVRYCKGRRDAEDGKACLETSAAYMYGYASVKRERNL